MAKRLHIWNGSTWVVPTNVSRWDGSSWVGVNAVRRWDGSSWVLHWPEEDDLDSNTIFNSDWQTVTTSRFSTSSFNTNEIPSTFTGPGNGLSYITRVDMRHGFKQPNDDDDFGAIGSAFSVRIFYTVDAQPPTFTDAFVDDEMESGPFSTVGSNTDTLRTFNFSVPSGRVLTGIRYRYIRSSGGGDNNLGSSSAGVEMFFRTMRVQNPDDNIELVGSSETTDTENDTVWIDDRTKSFRYSTGTPRNSLSDEFISGVTVGTADASHGGWPGADDDDWGLRPFRVRVVDFYKNGTIQFT